MFDLPAFIGRINRAAFHGYAPATKFRPEWTPGFLSFQGGAPNLKFASLAGGGQVYIGNQQMGRWEGVPVAGNIIYAQSGKIASITGGGQIPYHPAGLQALLGGRQGVGS